MIGEAAMTVYGYARVSSKGQSLEAQMDALRKAGCDQVYSEKVSAKVENARPLLAKLLKRVCRSRRARARQYCKRRRTDVDHC
jgi:DNA invertase Pin-like site-specific DNA recombinase